MKEKIIKFEEVYGAYAVIDGDYYEWTSRDGQPVFKRIDKKEFRKWEKDSEELASELISHFDGELILKEALMQIPKRDREKLKKLLRQKKEGVRDYKIKTRQHRCVDMKIGKFVLPIKG
jgi:ABC-type branched-subunit amino acid transport system substrate-binding protein